MAEIREIRVTKEERPLGAVVNELKGEVRDFVQTRATILGQEIKSKVSVLKIAVPMGAIAVAFLWLGLLCLTGLFVTLISAGLGGGVSGVAWAFLIVGGVYFIFAGMCALFARNEIKSKSLVPKRTLQVLKQDQVWLRNEAKSA